MRSVQIDRAQALPASTGTATFFTMTSNPDHIPPAPTARQVPASAVAEPGSLHAFILDQLDEDQAQEIVSIPLAGKTSIADHMIVASGRSTRQVASMATKLAERLKQNGYGQAKIEGLPAADWVLIDAGDVVVHLFRPEVRSFYNLERMWGFGEEKVG